MQVDNVLYRVNEENTNLDDKRVTCKSAEGRQNGERDVSILSHLDPPARSYCRRLRILPAQPRKTQSRFGRNRYKQVPNYNPLICFVPTKDRDAQACCWRCETGTRNALMCWRARDSRVSKRPCEWCKGISRDGPGTWQSEVPCTAHREQTGGGNYGRLAPIHKRQRLAKGWIY